MPSSTTPSGIVYPLSTDPIAPLNTVFQDLAETTQAALLVSGEVTAKTVDYTLALADAGQVVPMDKAGTATLTVPLNSAVAFPTGTVVWIYNISTDDVTVAGDAGVTVRNATTIGQYGQIRLRKRATNEWVAEPSQLQINNLQTQADNIEASVSELEETTEKTADYTLALGDKGKVVLMNKSTAATLTVPPESSVAFPIGSLIYVYNAATNNVTVAAGAGVTVRNAGTIAQYGQKLLRKRAADEWVLI